MKKNYTLLLIILSVLLFNACNTGTNSTTNQTDVEAQSKEALAAEIKKLEETLLSKVNETALDTATANALISNSRRYASKFPQDTMSATYLFKAAEVARGTGKYNLAINLWKQMENRYPDHSRAAQALMLQGFTYDSHLRQYNTASQYYQAFLDRYPNHPLAKDVQQLLNVIKAGKSPEELIKEFQSQQEK
jgi:TolA-binding protein